MNEWAEFRHFKYLLTILEMGGFRAAAEQLHTAQSNLSLQAKQFQEFASVRLYVKERSGRITPTEAGLAFPLIARSLLAARDEAFETLKAIERGKVASVRFGCSSLADQRLLQSLCETHRKLLPNCIIRPEYGDTTELVEEVLTGTIDAAIVTLPVDQQALQVEVLRKERLVACLRSDHPLARKSYLEPSDLRENLAILYHPQRHPEAHKHLLELLRKIDIQVEDYARASHPQELQAQVKGGYGFALIREGTDLDPELTTRPIAGVDWSVESVLIYRTQNHPKTLPLLARILKRDIQGGAARSSSTPERAPADLPRSRPIQLSLLRQADVDERADSHERSTNR